MVAQRSALEESLAARDVDGVRKAIADGADVNEPFADGLTPLCRTAALGEKRILKLLIAAKADIDAAPRREPEGDKKVSEVAAQVVDAGFAALHWAAREDRTECARLLIEAGGSVDVRAADDVTPFMLACKMGHHDCAKALKSAGADIEAANVRGGSAMVVACVMGEVETVRLLLSMRADPDAVTVALDDTDQPFQCRPLVTACRYDRPAVVSLLLGAGVSAEAMAIAMTELEAFPSFVECTKLVRQAVKRKEQATKRRGGAKAPATVSADDVARADAAMAALLAEENAKPKASVRSTTTGKKGKGGAVVTTPPTDKVCAPPRMDAASSSFSSASSAAERTSEAASEDTIAFLTPAASAPSAAVAVVPAATTSMKKPRRKGKSKANKMAAAAWVDDEEEVAAADVAADGAVDAAVDRGGDVTEYAHNSPTAAEEREEEEEMEAALLAVAKATRAMRMAAPPAAAAVGSSRRASKEGKEATDMNALHSEYHLYHGDEADGAPAAEMHQLSKVSSEGFSQGEGEEEGEEEGDEEDGGYGGHADRDGEGSSHNGGALVVEVTSDLLETHLASSRGGTVGGDDLSESQLDDLSSQQSDLVELDVIMKSEKAEELDLFLHRKKFTTSAMSFFLSKIREDGPPGTPCTPSGSAPAASDDEETVVKPKLRFAAPPPVQSYRSLPRAQAWTIPSTSSLDEEERRRRKARRPPPPPGFLPTSKYHELERRLQEELHHAKEREEALQEALARALSKTEAGA